MGTVVVPQVTSRQFGSNKEVLHSSSHCMCCTNLGVSAYKYTAQIFAKFQIHISTPCFTSTLPVLTFLGCLHSFCRHLFQHLCCGIRCKIAVDSHTPSVFSALGPTSHNSFPIVTAVLVQSQLQYCRVFQCYKLSSQQFRSIAEFQASFFSNWDTTVFYHCASSAQPVYNIVGLQQHLACSAEVSIPVYS